jgi:threonyl-tRNA synthetase
MLVVGERERSEESVSVREHHGAELGSMPVAVFLERLAGSYTAPH